MFLILLFSFFYLGQRRFDLNVKNRCATYLQVSLSQLLVSTLNTVFSYSFNSCHWSSEPKSEAQGELITNLVNENVKWTQKKERKKQLKNEANGKWQELQFL